MLDYSNNNIESNNNEIEPTETASVLQSEYLSLAMNTESEQKISAPSKGLSKTDPCSPMNPPGKPEKIEAKMITENVAITNGKIDGTKFEYSFSAPLANGKAQFESTRYYEGLQDQSAKGPDLYFVGAKEEIGKNTREVVVTPEPVSGGARWAIESYPEPSPVNPTEYLVRSARCELDENGEVLRSPGVEIIQRQPESKYHYSVKFYAGLVENPRGQIVGAGLKREVFYHGDSGKKLADFSYLGKDGKPTLNGKAATGIYYDFDTQQKTAEVEFDRRGIEAKRVEFKSGVPYRTLEYHDNRVVKREIRHDYLGGILISDIDENSNTTRRETQTAKGDTELVEEKIGKGIVSLSFFDPTSETPKTPYAIVECKHDAKSLEVKSMKILDEKGNVRGFYDATKGEAPLVVSNTPKGATTISVNMKFFKKNGEAVAGEKFDAMLKSPRFQRFAQDLLKSSK